MKLGICLCALVVTFAAATARPEEMTAERHKAELDKLLATMEKTIAAGPFKPTVQSFDTYRVPEWYADAKLGIFIHYGIFSVPGYSGVGCWYGHCMYDPKDGAFKFHREMFGPQDKFGYKDLAPHLTANRFDADEWVALFKEAGARFVVPVSCFHDGFAMWDSKLTDWNAVKVGPKRDYDGLLATAARRQGLRFGVAWHHFRIPIFFSTGRRPGTDIHPPYSGTPWSCYGTDTIGRDFIDDGLGRLVELVDGYQPDLVWFDDCTGNIPRADLRRFLAFYFNRAAQWKKDVAINDKHEDLFPAKANVLDFERGKTNGLKPNLWQTDTSVSWRDWSYMRNDSFKTVDELVRELVDIVSKNGVLLLDIAPRPDGSIPPEPQAILRGIGAWLKINGEAIYGTRPCWALGYGEGAANSGGGGFSDRQVEYSHHDFRFTTKGNVLYAIAMDWPEVDDHFLIKSLNHNSTVASGGVASVSLLGGKEPLDWKLTSDGLWIHRPDISPCDGAYVFRIEMRGIAVEQLSAKRLDAKRIRASLRLRNLNAEPAREEIEILDNGRPVGRQTFDLKAGEVLLHRADFKAPQRESLEIITASTPKGKPFTAHDQLLSPPDFTATRTFDGSARLAVKNLGKHERLTILLWCRVDAINEPFAALLNTDGWDRGSMHVQYMQSGQLQVALNGPENGAACHSNVAAGQAGAWHMTAVSYDAVARQCKVYIDGKLDAETAMNQAIPISLDAFSLGGWDRERRPLVGTMADVRIYGRVLSADEIQAALRGRASSDGLLAAWDFLKTDGDAVLDVSGHGHHASITK